MECALVKFPLNDDTWEKIHTAFNDAERILSQAFRWGRGGVSGQVGPCAAAAFFPMAPLGLRDLRTKSEAPMAPARLDGLSQSLVRGRGVAAHLWVTQRGVAPWRR